MLSTINLSLIVGLTVAGFVATQVLTTLTTLQQLAVWASVAALGPFVFYRCSKGLWVSLVFLTEGLYIPWPNQ